MLKLFLRLFTGLLFMFLLIVLFRGVVEFSLHLMGQSNLVLFVLGVGILVTGFVAGVTSVFKVFGALGTPHYRDVFPPRDTDSK